MKQIGRSIVLLACRQKHRTAHQSLQHAIPHLICPRR